MQAFSPERTVEALFLQLTPKTTTFLQHNGLFPPLSLSLSLLQDRFLPLYSQFSRPSFCFPLYEAEEGLSDELVNGYRGMATTNGVWFDQFLIFLLRRSRDVRKLCHARFDGSEGGNEMSKLFPLR